MQYLLLTLDVIYVIITLVVKNYILTKGVFTMSLEKIELIEYSKTEDAVNSATHAAGAVIGVVALTLCLIKSIQAGSAMSIVSSLIYGISIITLYTCSATYHGLHPGNAKRVMRIVDHSVIYLLIAGTMTPVCLGPLREVSTAAGWGLFAVAWGCAAIGIALTWIDFSRLSFRVIRMILYIAIGWTTLLVIKPLIQAVSVNGAILIAAGGVVYTIGAIFYGFGRNHPYIHATFHMFVLAGTLLHFIAIYIYCIPAPQTVLI